MLTEIIHLPEQVLVSKAGSKLLSLSTILKALATYLTFKSSSPSGTYSRGRLDL